MFDTSVVKAHAVAAPHRFTLFGLSLALHSAAAVTAIAVTIASVEFPRQAPDQTEIFNQVMPAPIPPPYGRPAPPRRAVVPAEQPKQPAKTTPVTAPADVSEQLPAQETTVSSEAVSGPSGEEGTGEGPFGDPNGTPGGTGEEPAGLGNGVHTPGGEVRGARVLGRVEPEYPRALIPMRREALVRVRCIIGSDGRVREAQVIQSSFPSFNDSVLRALERWTFAPGTRHGRAVDTYFELTVRFQVR